MKYWKVSYNKENKNDWCIIPVNDIWRSKKMLNENFISAEYFRDWPCQDNSRNSKEFDVDSYQTWLNSNNQHDNH